MSTDDSPVTLVQGSLGFPEVDLDAFVHWSSQGSEATSSLQTPPLGDKTSPPAISSSTSHHSTSFQSINQPSSSYRQAGKHSTASLIWESAGMMPRLKLPVLPNREQGPPPRPPAPFPGVPPDMPSGPSIATARYSDVSL